MATGNNNKAYSQQCYDSVFLSHAWGSKTNSGVNYKRAYSKTKKAKQQEGS